MEYTLKSGKILTEEDIALLSEAVENGDLDVLGQAGKIVAGRRENYPPPLLISPAKGFV